MSASLPIKKFIPKYGVDDLEAFIRKHTTFAVFGTGFEAQRIKKQLIGAHKKVVAFLDNARANHGKQLDGVPIVHPSKFDFASAKVLVASLNEVAGPNWEIAASQMLVSKYGLRPFVDFVSLCGFFLNMEHYERYRTLLGKRFYLHYAKNRRKFAKACALLSDARSRQIYAKVIDYKLRALEQHRIDIRNLPCPPAACISLEKDAGLYASKLPRQLPEELRTAIAGNLSMRPYSYQKLVYPDGKSIILDVGAFNGDTAGMFAYLSPGATIYAFEPVEELFPKVKAVCEAFMLHPVKAGLWDTTGTVHFTKLRRKDSVGMGSFAGHGADSISVFALDDFVHRHSLPRVDFIKMDIEGSELKALEGGKKTIQKYRPDLAICIYHNVSDLWSIPLWIKEQVPEYKLYIDHKHIHPAETVCYATCGMRRPAAGKP